MSSSTSTSTSLSSSTATKKKKKQLQQEAEEQENANPIDFEIASSQTRYARLSTDPNHQNQQFGSDEEDGEEGYEENSAKKSKKKKKEEKKLKKLKEKDQRLAAGEDSTSLRESLLDSEQSGAAISAKEGGNKNNIIDDENDDDEKERAREIKLLKEQEAAHLKELKKQQKKQEKERKKQERRIKKELKRRNAKEEEKDVTTFFSNDRTYLKWTRTGITELTVTMAIISSVAQENRLAIIFFFVFGALTVIYIIYGFCLWLWRARKLKQQLGELSIYHDALGPILLTISLLAAFAVCLCLFIFSFWNFLLLLFWRGSNRKGEEDYLLRKIEESRETC